jgi:pimeloyl-ACP methyl ester carboxylesterase|tara:strand:- start:20 stop:490 length:471 start_codon:yes stop_codon:yes gene_type:complete
MAKNVVFLGANGFPVHTYAPLLNKIRYDNSVASLFPIDYFKHFTELNSDWNNAVQHTIDKLLLSPSPVTAVGHSAGGALLMCVAGRRPELFEKLIVVDPPMFDLKMRVFISIGKAIPKQLVENVHPLVKGAVRKRDQFSSKTEAGEYFRSRSLFKR